MEKEQGIHEIIVLIKNYIQSLPELTTFTDEDIYHKSEQRLLQMVQNNQAYSQQVRAILDKLNFRDKGRIIKGTYEAIRGLDILGRIIEDKSITEIMINGYDHIFVERKGHVEKINAQFESPQRLTDIIIKFVAQAGRAVNEADPIVDTRLADGSRVNVVLPPIALNGPIVTIRRFPEQTMTVEELIDRGSITPEVAGFLQKLVEAKYNLFVSGGTGSGKTTFLNALSNYIPKDERIITIEDSAELQIKGIHNIVRLETRNAQNAENTAVTIKDLIKSSLRMRPERIVVGEVRGGEALDMLQAMNTGHDGSLSTGHANSPKDMISRLETMVLSGTEGLPLEAIRQQIASGIDIIIHLARMRDKSRRTVAITEVAGYENGQVKLNPLYTFIEDKEKSTKDNVVGTLTRTENTMMHTEKFAHAGMTIE